MSDDARKEAEAAQTSDDDPIAAPGNDFVRIVSADEQIFIVKRKHLLVSPVLKEMLCDSSSAASDEINLPHMPSRTLRHLIKYMIYNWHYLENTDGPAPEFEIPVDSALEILMGAHYLQI